MFHLPSAFSPIGSDLGEIPLVLLSSHPLVKSLLGTCSELVSIQISAFKNDTAI